MDVILLPIDIFRPIMSFLNSHDCFCLYATSKYFSFIDPTLKLENGMFSHQFFFLLDYIKFRPSFYLLYNKYLHVHGMEDNIKQAFHFIHNNLTYEGDEIIINAFLMGGYCPSDDEFYKRMEKAKLSKEFELIEEKFCFFYDNVVEHNEDIIPFGNKCVREIVSQISEMNKILDVLLKSSQFLELYDLEKLLRKN